MTSIKNFYAEIRNNPNVVGACLGYRGGVVGNSIGYLALTERPSTPAQLLGDSTYYFHGAPVDTLTVGKLWAQGRTDRVRPAPGGVSVGHYSITAGTLGMVVRNSKKKGHWFILSNNHVLAASNSGDIGDPILQPGTADGGINPDDVIGELAEYVEIVFGGTPPPIPPDCGVSAAYVDFGNAVAALLGSGVRVAAHRIGAQAANLVDAAIASVKHNDVSTEVLGIGEISGVIEPELGMPVRKSGRTTGLTTGSIIGVDAVVTVGYGGGLSATFEDQIITSNMSQPGDSGSVLVSADSQDAVGLLFAGSDQITIHGRMSTVMDLLEVEPIT